MTILDRFPLRPRRVAASVAAAALGAALCACSHAPTDQPSAECDPGGALVLVVSVHEGGSAPSIPAEASCYVESALRHGIPISAVTAEGSPRLILKSATFILNDGQPEDANPQAFGDDLGAARARVLQAVKGASAQSDHNDLMAALAMAADQGNRENAARAHLLILDAGLSDAGSLNMSQPGMTEADPAEVAAFIRDHGGCPPSLAGVSVTMYGAGYGVAPQPKLSNAQVVEIGKLWQATVAACGGRLDLVSTPRTDPSPTTSYTVIPVQPRADAVVPIAAGETLTFDGAGALRFSPDSAELADPAAAAAALQPMADYLHADSRHTIAISGTTSNGPTAWPSYVALSQARAETVAAILTQRMAVDRSQIRCAGLGYTATPPALDPASAALNRTTHITIDS